jgi:PKD repeat protein
VTFDASASGIPGSTVTDYAWDFDGSHSYAVNGGSAPKVGHVFSVPGTYTVDLRVTRAGGRVDTVSGTVGVAPKPPRNVGLSINRGDFATDNPHVELEPVWPAGASRALVSNDGGFGTAGGTMTVPLTARIPWTLKQTGPERLPKIVYMRFLGVGVDTTNFTDDIILDQKPPTLQSADLVGASRGKRGKRIFRVRLKAKDTIVGVCALQLSAKRMGGTVIAVSNCHKKGVTHYAKTLDVKLSSAPVYARVKNSAGSWSTWHQLVQRFAGQQQ